MTISLPRRALLSATAGGAFAASRPAGAQSGSDWPNQPIRMVLPYAAGGATDVIGRLLSDTLSQRLPQRVVVENRTGAGGNIGAASVARARPDGATFLFTNTAHAVNRALYARLDYDPAKDLTPVTVLAEGPMVVLVPNSTPTRTFAEFAEHVRAKPGDFGYGSTGTGGMLQLAALLVTRAAGLRMQEIPYRGGAPAAQDLIAGRIEMLVDAGVTGFPLAKSGQVRALAVTSAERSTVMPDVPTMAELGYPEATVSVWQVVLAPTGTPAQILGRMQQEIAGILGDGPLRSRFMDLGAERIVASTPDQARAYVEAEMARWERVLRDAGINPQ